MQHANRRPMHSPAAPKLGAITLHPAPYGWRLECRNAHHAELYRLGFPLSGSRYYYITRDMLGADGKLIDPAQRAYLAQYGCRAEATPAPATPVAYGACGPKLNYYH